MNLRTPLISLPAISLAATPALAAKPHIGPIVKDSAGKSDEKATATPVPPGPPPVPDAPLADKNTPAPPTLPDMTAYVLMDATTGAILAEAAPNLKVPPASLAKLMTAHIVYQALHHGSLKPDQTVPVSVAAWHAGGSSMFIDTTAVVNVDQLLHGLIIDSGNDAAIALAEQVAGSQDAFVNMMNAQASQIGLINTTYTNVTGLPDPAMRTTALDVAKLSHVILQDEPEILNISKLQSYSFNNITQASWNPVLAHDPTVDGLKTGLTQESGHCIDATALRGGRRLIAVVMGGPTWHESTAAIESILNYGEKFFTDISLATPGAQIDTLQSADLDAGAVAIGAGETRIITLPSDAAGNITHSITYTADLRHGVTQGETLGTITYTLDGKTIGTIPAVALADAPAASFTTKISRAIKKLL
jgi:D-alanyl-D-alanine carboxypeptidase (penicillin-binding protein 5/6)